MQERAQTVANRFASVSELLEPRVAMVYDVLYGRHPSADETAAARRFLASTASGGSELTRWEQYCQVLLSSNEFMYIR